MTEWATIAFEVVNGILNTSYNHYLCTNAKRSVSAAMSEYADQPKPFIDTPTYQQLV